MRSSTVWALVLLVLVPGAAGSQSIYTCAVKGKPTSYQTEPCAGNAKLKAIRHFIHNPEADRAPVAVRPGQQGQARQPSRPRSARLHNVYNGGSQSACENAKRDRDAWERRVGLSRSYDSLQAWNDRVQRACK